MTFADSELFDAIVRRLVIEFVPDAHVAISRLRTLLRPDGYWLCN